MELKSGIFILFIMSTCTIFGLADPGDELLPHLLFGTYQKLSILNLNTGEVTVVYNHAENQVYFIAYHYRRNLIYWSDFHQLYRIRYPTLNTTAEVVISKPDSINGIAIDDINDHVYWCYAFNAIMRSELDGSDIRTIMDTGQGSYPYAIALDVANEWIYFSLFGNDRGIEKCTLNGSNRQTVIAYAYANHIHLDITANRMYWTNKGYPFDVRSSTLEGSNISVIVQDQNLNEPFGFDLYGNYMYISYHTSTKIVRVDKSTGLNPLNLVTSEYGIYAVSIYFNKGIKCRKYKTIQNEEKRSKDYIIDQSADPYSDESLEEDWYRVISNNGDKMPTYPPGVMHCGTIHPVWLNGTLPSVEDENVTRQTCVQTSTNICNETIDIEIRNCDGFYVYRLQKTPSNSAFCFGNGPVLCPPGQSSESGYYPGCSSLFPAETVNVKVTPELIHGPTYSIPGYRPAPSLLPVFKCVPDSVSNGTYVFDVYWYINGENVTVYTNVPMDSLNITHLRTEDWMNTHKLNMKVKCAIRLRYRATAIPGHLLYSNDFPAGVFPEKYNYDVIEGDSIDISFTSTVPVACISSDPRFRKNCEQNFYLFQPFKHSNIGECTNSIANRDIVFKAQFCGIRFGSLDWNETKTIQVYGFSDGLYNRRDRSTFIRLSTFAVSILNEFWKDIQIPDVKVTVIDKDSILKNRLCQSYNDPHITTFDGRLYHYMEIGEFVMYRNDRGPYWVHALLTNCGFGWTGSACHCGIAIRSRNSLFVLRTCEKISRHEKYLLQHPYTELITCDENDLLIDQTGSTYKITLPIGTEITFTISDWSMFISIISIKPSIYDIKEAKGLCGVPSSTRDSSDDFTHRTLGPIQDVQAFGDSWRISPSLSSEQLFISDPDFLTNSYAIHADNVKDNSSRFCVCDREATSIDSFDNFNIVHCNLTESTEYCTMDSKLSGNTVIAFYTTCSVSRKTDRSVNQNHKIVRRSTSDTDDVFSFSPLSYDQDENKTNLVPQTFRNGWTEKAAKQQCIKTIQNTIPSYLYAGYVELQEDFFIQSCIKDIELTGDTTFLPDTIGAMVTNIQTEISKNESLYFEKTSYGSQTLLEYITSFLCPNNCSNNGNCTLGVCSCAEGFAGNDCSQSLSTPPLNLSLSSDGVCTLGTRACERTNVYGYFYSTTIWSQLNHFEILHSSIRHELSEKIVIADYRNMFMISVRLRSSRRRRSTSQNEIAEGYEIRLSNDGIHFGDSVTLIIYDEKCYMCNATTISCTDLGICQSSVSKTTNDNFNIAAVIAIVISVFIAVVVLLVGVSCYRFKHPTPKNPFETPEISNISAFMNNERTVSDIELQMESRQTPQ